VSGFDAERLQIYLDRLVAAELLAGDRPSRGFYRFRHALIRDAAYDSLLHSRRRELHRRVGIALRDRFPDVAESAPELLAHHFSEARAVEEALEYWERAGLKATASGAHTEAIDHFDKALSGLESTPDSLEHEQREVRLLVGKGMGLVATRGYAAPEVEATFARASKLCEKLGDTPLSVLYGIWGVALARGDQPAVERIAERFSRLIHTSQDRPTLLLSNNGLGLLALYRGDYVRAREFLERGIAGYDLALHRELMREYGYGGGVYGHLYLMWGLWIMGYPHLARRYQDEALAIAEWMPEPYTTAVVLNFCAILAHEMRDAEAVQDRVAQLLELANENNFIFWIATGSCLAGWAAAQRGELDAGIAQIQQGLSIYQMTGARLSYAVYLSQLVEAYLLAKKRAEGLKAVEEALALSRGSLDCFYAPELTRLKGELLALEEQDRGEAERWFRWALERTHAQQAKSFELRAAMSLARLLRSGGQVDEARALVSGAYGRFTEGFETRDLCEARKLLESLSAQVASGSG
jgi:predicted ATPase